MHIIFSLIFPVFVEDNDFKFNVLYFFFYVWKGCFLEMRHLLENGHYN